MDSDHGDELAAYVATLFPLQQQTIATAQLAGCRFERRTVERHSGVWGRVGFGAKWITTTVYEAFLPDGTQVGTFEDIYESAIVCLSILDTPHGAPRRGEIASGAFALLPENDLGETN